MSIDNRTAIEQLPFTVIIDPGVYIIHGMTTIIDRFLFLVLGISRRYSNNHFSLNILLQNCHLIIELEIDISNSNSSSLMSEITQVRRSTIELSSVVL
jgi:hypothetical protein